MSIFLCVTMHSYVRFGRDPCESQLCRYLDTRVVDLFFPLILINVIVAFTVLQLGELIHVLLGDILEAALWGKKPSIFSSHDLCHKKKAEVNFQVSVYYLQPFMLDLESVWMRPRGLNSPKQLAGSPLSCIRLIRPWSLQAPLRLNAHLYIKPAF